METEKKKIYVNTSASRMVRFIRVMAWILFFAGIIASFILNEEGEEDVAGVTLIAGFAFFFIAIFIRPVYVRTLAAEIEIARAKDEYVLCPDDALTKEIKF